MLVPLILAGEADTRLWPVSQELSRKPFMRMPDGKSLLYKAYTRAARLNRVTYVLTVTNREQYLRSKEVSVIVAGCYPFCRFDLLLEIFARGKVAFG